MKLSDLLDPRKLDHLLAARPLELPMGAGVVNPRARKKDDQARAAIGSFTLKLRELARGAIPVEWQAWTAQSLSKVPLRDFMRPFMRRRVGRPRNMSEEFQRKLVEAVEEEKRNLRRNGFRSVTDRRVIRQFLAAEYRAMLEADKKRCVDYWTKVISRARKPEERRPKKSMKPRRLQPQSVKRP